MLSIGLLGAGRIGTLHGRNIASHPKARLAAIADAVAAPAEALGRDLNVPVRSVEQILADPAIQQAGKAIFCE